MVIEIDVSGEDILQKDYTICLADNNGIIAGFKFDDKFVNILSSRYGQGFYKYRKSDKQRALFKVRIYCIIIYSLLKSLNIKEKVKLEIDRDFDGREKDILNNLDFLIKKLDLDIEDIVFDKLGKESNAHKYAYLMRKDTKNKLDTYNTITIDAIEEFLKK